MYVCMHACTNRHIAQESVHTCSNRQQSALEAFFLLLSRFAVSGSGNCFRRKTQKEIERLLSYSVWAFIGFRGRDSTESMDGYALLRTLGLARTGSS